MEIYYSTKEIIKGDYDEKAILDNLSLRRLAFSEYLTILKIFIYKEDWDSAYYLIEKAAEDCSSLELLFLCRIYYLGTGIDIVIKGIDTSHDYSLKMLYFILQFNIANYNSFEKLNSCKDYCYYEAITLYNIFYNKVNIYNNYQLSKFPFLEAIFALKSNNEIDKLQYSDVFLFKNLAFTTDYQNITDSIVSNKKLEEQVYLRWKHIAVLIYHIKLKEEASAAKKAMILKDALEVFPDDKELIGIALNLNLTHLLKKITPASFVIYNSKIKELNQKYKYLVSESIITKIKPTYDISVVSLGGCEEVGASCHIISYKNYNIMLDCGLKPGNSSKNVFPQLDNYNKNIDAIIISHAHLDHVGGVLKATSIWDKAPIFATKETIEFSEILFNDMINHGSDSEIDINISKLMEEDALKNALNNMHPINIGMWHRISKDIIFRLHSAGHILGASMVELNINGFTVLYTGDFCLHNQQLVCGCDLLSLPLKPDLLISEATYVGRPFASDWKCQKEKLKNEIINKVENKGSVLLPAFALGRSQELISIIGEMISNMEIKRNYRYYIGGLAETICKKVKELNINGDFEKWFSKFSYLNKRNIPDSNCIIIASSGMLKKGSVSYLVAKKWKENRWLELYGIYPCGYMDEESENEYQNNLEQNSDIDCQRFSMSAHANDSDIIKLIEFLNPGIVLFVHWGEKKLSNKKQYISNIYNKLNTKCFLGLLKNGEKIYPFDYFETMKRMKRIIRKKNKEGNSNENS